MGDSYRDELSLSRRNHKGHTTVAAPRAPRTICEEGRALRSEYFKKKAQSPQAKATRRLLDG